MSDLTYHLEAENKNGKYYLSVRLISATKKAITKDNLCSFASSTSEKSGLDALLKEHYRTESKTIHCIPVAPERVFHILKWLGATGRIFFQGKKVVVDPFTSLDFYFQAERQNPETALVTGHWKLGNQKGALHECEWVIIADPSWILKDGIIRPIKEEISSRWIHLAVSGPQLLQGAKLSHFLSQTHEEIQCDWTSGNASQVIEPFPLLILSCRHGGFADLWFDYGSYGKVAAHDSTSLPWRHLVAERSWEKDLLETDFSKKLVERSHYYCPLDKVTKSLTFLLEIGWTILDAHGRKVLRQKKAELDAQFSEEKTTIHAKIHYDAHQADLKDLVGAFNRKEHFVELSPHAVGLLDRENFSKEWGDFAEAMTTDGIHLKKQCFGLLEQLLEQPNLLIREDLKQKIAKLSRFELSSPIDPSALFQGTLFSYQKEGLQWLKSLETRGFSGLLGDEMGLGKTVQVLAFFSLLSFQHPCLIVVPTSLLFNWKREIEKFLPSLTVYSHQGKERLQSKAELQQKQIILTSYALLRIDIDLLQQVEYQIIVLDEGQTIKNPDSQIAKCCFRLQAQIRLVMTGTPIENRLEDLWSIFHFLQPDLLGQRQQFQAEVMLSQMGNQYLERTKRKIKPFLLRRKKEQVALQLPPKLEQTVFVEMTEAERAIYERWLRNTKQGLLKKVSLDGATSHRMEILEAILRLRQLCAHPRLVEESQEEDSAKFHRVIADLEEVVEEKRKVLVYSQFTKILHLLRTSIQEKGWNHVYLDGSTANREEIVNRFQDDPQVCIFLISLKAGGVGLNLTAADYVFLYDPWWNEAVEHQAIARAHRVGKQGTVIARRYITALSIEEKIMRLKAHKTSLSQQLLESEAGFSQPSLDDLLELLT